MFEPYRCEECIYGKYSSQDSCWVSSRVIQKGMTVEDALYDIMNK